MSEENMKQHQVLKIKCSKLNASSDFLVSLNGTGRIHGFHYHYVRGFSGAIKSGVHSNNYNEKVTT